MLFRIGIFERFSSRNPLSGKVLTLDCSGGYNKAQEGAEKGDTGEMSNVITATFTTGTNTAMIPRNTLFQWDTGQVLRFVGIDLPSVYQVHFANSYNSEEATVAVGSDDSVSIPDEQLLTAGTLYAWVVLTEEGADQETEYVVVIPVMARRKPGYVEPSPEEETYISQLIALMEEATSEAQTSAQTAVDAKDAVAVMQTEIEALVDHAEEIEQTVEGLKDAAETAEEGAERAKTEAQTAASSASQSATIAGQHEQNAAASDASASQSATIATEAAQSAYADSYSARGYAITASQAAQTATEKADTATTAATTATGAKDDAISAKNAAQAAQTAAETASTSAGNSATAAGQARQGAEQAKNAAQASATAAGQSAQQAASKVAELTGIALLIDDDGRFYVEE